jgi:leucyl aminopeptidase
MEPNPEIIERTSLVGTTTEKIATALGEGAALNTYRYDKYITSERNKPRVKTFEVISADRTRIKELQKGLRFASIVCEGTCLARDLANAPANEIYPETLADAASKAGRTAGFKVTTFNEGKIRSLKMGGLLGVSQGSARTPRFIIMEHRGKGQKLPVVALVGKGVTFDSGGISIKPAQGMGEMKMDMSGAAAVIGTMQAAARL